MLGVTASPGYGGINWSMRSLGSLSANRSRINSVCQLPPRSQAIMMAQARLSTGVQGSGCKPRITNSGGRARSVLITALTPSA